MLYFDIRPCLKRLTAEEKGILFETKRLIVREILEQVVGDSTEGTGRNAAVSGYRIGGKTGTSEIKTLKGEVIVSFMGFAPADDPQIMALCIIDTPQGQYYGGQIAAPVVRQLFENILPYLNEIGYNLNVSQQK